MIEVGKPQGCIALTYKDFGDKLWDKAMSILKVLTEAGYECTFTDEMVGNSILAIRYVYVNEEFGEDTIAILSREDIEDIENLKAHREEETKKIERKRIEEELEKEDEKRYDDDITTPVNLKHIMPDLFQEDTYSVIRESKEETTPESTKSTNETSNIEELQDTLKRVYHKASKIKDKPSTKEQKEEVINYYKQREKKVREVVQAVEEPGPLLKGSIKEEVEKIDEVSEAERIHDSDERDYG